MVGRDALLAVSAFAVGAQGAAVTTRYANTTTPAPTTSASLSFEPTSSSVSDSSAVSSISSIFGPYMLGFSYTWSQWITPTVVGTVLITVNEANNRTISTTSFNSEYQTNGSMAILTRTDTDAAGTVTQVVSGEPSQAFTVTYPDHLNYYEDVMSWDAIFPTTAEKATCCQYSATTSAAPSLTSAITTPGSTDTADPSGWLYTLVGEGGGAQYPVNASQISSIWDGAELTIPYTGCPYTTCGPYETGTQLPPQAASSAAFLLETSTTTIPSGDAADPTDPSEPSEPAGPTEPTELPVPTTGTVSPPQTSDNNGPGTSVEETGAPSPTVTGEDPLEPVEPTAAPANPPQSGEDGSEPAGPTGTAADPLEPVVPTTAGVAAPESPTTAPGDSLDEDDSSSATTDPAQAIISLIGSLTLPSSEAEETGADVPDDDQGTAAGDTNDGAGLTPSSPKSTGDDAAESDVNASPPVVEIGGETITQQLDSAFVISSQTLSAGASITIGNGEAATVVAFETSNSLAAVVVGSSTAAILSNIGKPALSTFTIGSSVVLADQSTRFVIAGETLAPGSSVVVDGTTIQLASGAAAVVVDGSTQTASPRPTKISQLPELTVGDTVVTPDPSSNYVIDDQTLSPGSSIVVDGTTIELTPGATAVVVDGTTQVLAPSDALDEYIWSAIGGTGASASSSLTSETISGVPQQTGSAASRLRAGVVLTGPAIAGFLSAVVLL